MLKFLSILVFASTFFTFGCGSGGSSGAPRGNVCTKNADPIPVNLQPGSNNSGPQKITFEPDASGVGQYPGKYEYNGAEFFYTNKSENLKLHFVDVQNPKTKEWKFGFACVSGIKPTTELNLQMTGVSEMVVAAGQKVIFGVRNFVLNYKNLTPFPDFKPGDGSKFEAPSKVYEGKVGEFYFYKMAANDVVNFQIRSFATTGNETFNTVIKLKRIPPPEPAKAK